MSYHTGATFYPGGHDSYYMPEVISPQPQRAQEVPVNMQGNVANMEQQASWNSPPAQNAHPQQHNSSSTPNGWNMPTSGNFQNAQDYGYGSTNTTSSQPYQQSQYQSNNQVSEQPNFSLFPQLRHRGSNVPPSDEEREASLEAAREAVLSSNDFETQLTWAQDALAYVEVAVQNENNLSTTQGARPRTPRVEHILREDAVKVVEFLANQHHPRAEFIKGTWLEFGKFNHRIDKREAYNCYIRASDRGYARAYYRIGMQFENSNEALKAIKYYQMGVDAGDAASCYRLGMMTLLGQHGQMRDFDRGLYLIQTAAAKADDNAPQGAYVLGMLQAGELAQVSIPEAILPRNLSSAKSNIEKAAFLGFAKAQLRMGQAYELGDLGCPFDPALSLHYNALAARQGETEAEMAISKWFLCGQDGVFEKNEEMAFTYAQRAAVSGLATAQFAVGYFYEVGIYVPSDLKQAREWYQKAEEGGNTDARKRIDAVSRSKTISRKDHENVALQRIRQQHAAGGKTPSMPTLPEISTQQPTAYDKPLSPSLDMPDPARLSLNATPIQQRPTSTAPYPVGNTSLNALSPHVRPTSAFGINPRLQQQSQYPPGPGIGRPDPQRNSSMPNSHSSNEGYPPNSGYRPDGRRPSAPQSSYPPSQRPQGSQQPWSNQTAPYSSPPNQASSRLQQPAPNQGTPRPSQNQPGPAPPPKGADIGFAAPLEVRPERKESRPPASQRPSQAYPPQQSHNSQSPGSGSRPPPQNQFSQSRPSPTQSSQSRPTQNQNSQPRPQQNQYIQPASITPSKPISAPPTPRPGQQKPATVAAATAVTRPPGKGPKTFDEMGVPKAQKESDCVVM